MGKIIRNGRIDRDAIRDELYRVVEWPEESDKKYVTTAFPIQKQNKCFFKAV